MIPTLYCFLKLELLSLYNLWERHVLRSPFTKQHTYFSLVVLNIGHEEIHISWLSSVLCHIYSCVYFHLTVSIVIMALATVVVFLFKRSLLVISFITGLFVICTVKTELRLVLWWISRVITIMPMQVFPYMGVTLSLQLLMIFYLKTYTSLWGYKLPLFFTLILCLDSDTLFFPAIGIEATVCKIRDCHCNTVHPVFVFKRSSFKLWIRGVIFYSGQVSNLPGWT